MTTGATTNSGTKQLAQLGEAGVQAVQLRIEMSSNRSIDISVTTQAASETIFHTVHLRADERLNRSPA